MSNWSSSSFGTLKGGHEARDSNLGFLGTAAWDDFASIKLLGLFASLTLFVNSDIFKTQRVKMISWE